MRREKASEYLLCVVASCVGGCHAKLLISFRTESSDAGLFVMIRYVHPVFPDVAQGAVAETYAQIKRDFGRVVEPFVLNSLLPRLLAGMWTVCRETELVGMVSRVVKEAVAASVSMLNRRPYCVEAHTIMLNSIGDHAIADAISDARYWKIRNAKVGPFVDWALTTSTPGQDMLLFPPFSREEAPEIIGTAVF